MSQSNVSNERYEGYHVHTDESRDVSTLLAPAVSCWEAWRWELTRAALQRSSTPSLGENELTHPKRGQER